MAFTTIQGSGANDATSFVGTSGVDTILIQNQNGPVFVGAQQANDSVGFANFQALVSNYSVRGGQGNDAIGTAAAGGTISFASSFFNGNNDADNIVVVNVSASTVYGGQGADSINATGLVTGSIVNGNKNNDTINATASGASIFGGQGSDNLTIAGTTSSVVQGDLDGDTITVTGTVGSSTINGNGGNDSIDATGVTAFSTSTIFGGSGNDTISANGATQGVVISADLGNDNVTGSTRNDTILLVAGTNTAAGLAGNDSITGGSAVDSLNYSESGTGNVDTITSFTSGTDVIGVTFGNIANSVGGNLTLSDGGGTDIGAAVAAGALAIGNVTQNTNFNATTTPADFLFLNTGASTFAAAIGTATVTVAGMGAGETMLATWFDTDTNEAVVGAVAGATTTTITNGSAFSEIARIAMSAGNYTAANITNSLAIV